MKVEELKSKVFIFLGPFGTGKTELSMNFSIVRKRMGGEVALADIDIISPYFRIRDFVGILEEEGIKVILPPLHLL
ncbi:MAG TPA: cobalamin biosynthesis protein CobQ, partial [Thermotogales bacterium]|nr:cobalamin biosynthesis protein CobQ [Thermotogales bacterium]